jgi:hypothetical protein
MANKKWKNKAKKQQKAQIIQTDTENRPQEVAAKAVSDSKKVDKKSEAVHENFLHNMEEIRYDVKKIVVIVVILTVLLTVTVITNNKSGWVLEISDKLFNLF